MRNRFLAALALVLMPLASFASNMNLNVLSSTRDLSVGSMDSVDGEALNARVENLRTHLQGAKILENLSSDAPTDQKSFCERANDSTVVSDLAQNIDNLTGFNNDGGFFNATGVCWWHARLQRSAFYLTVFHPERPPPTTRRQIRRIFRALQHNRGVVEINGYHNWKEFSAAWQGLLQHYLNVWQFGDTFIRQAWINGLMNRWPLHGAKAAARLKKLIQVIVIEVKEQKRITYAKLTMKFPDAHAWLIVDATPLSDGVDLSVVDSNYSAVRSHYIPAGVFTYHYKYGQESLNMRNVDPDDDNFYGDFNPYVQHREDFGRIYKAIANYCSRPNQ